MEALKDKKHSENHDRSLLNTTAFMVVLGPIAAVTIYFIWFSSINNQLLSKNSADWGVFGDFVGGVANPLVAFFALMWLIRSVTIQREELRATRKELKEAADAQQKTVEHHQTMKGIDDCQIYAKLLSKKLKTIETAPFEIYNISATNSSHGPIGLLDSIEDLPDFIESNNKCGDQAIDWKRFFDEHYTFFMNSGTMIDQMNTLILTWENLHGKSTPCFSAYFYKDEHRSLAVLLFWLEVIRERSLTSFSRVPSALESVLSEWPTLPIEYKVANVFSEEHDNP
jgi:hypothetical protein